MKTLKLIGIAVAILFFGAVGFYGYLGGFHSVEVARGAFGPVEIIFATHVGPYNKLGKSWQRFQVEWEDAGLSECDALAVYLDPPGTPPSDLRAVLACRIDGFPEGEKNALRTRFASFILPQSQAFLSAFPFKNDLSFMLAPAKVFPAIGKRMAADKLEALAAIEVYGVMGEMTEIGFVVPIGVDRASYQGVFDAFPH